jgi:hypothetical protein
MCCKSLVLLLLIFLAYPLSAQNNAKWDTYFEKSGFKGTPSYSETVEYFRKFDAFPEVKMQSIGVSPQGRDIYCLIVSRDKAFAPAEAKSLRKPVVMIISGIHAGEIEGKDASMLLLRDILVTKEKQHLIDSVVLLIVPVFSADGHERRSRHNRINQDGPEETGWRTTAVNLNLNRDWLKADAAEMQHLLKLFNKWMPDFIIDSHTSNGADYQYPVTYSMEKYRNIYEGTALWNKYTFIPKLKENVEQQGFLISPYVQFIQNIPDSGLVEYPAPPRFSTGYCAVQNRPALLIETHMMKPYKERVFATLAVFNSALQYINKNPRELIELNQSADINTAANFIKERKYLPVSFRPSEEPKQFLYKGIEAVQEWSDISGAMKTVYTGKPYEKNIPYFDTVHVADSIQASSAYIIPQEWGLLAERMKLHGIEVEQLKNEETLRVKRYKFKDVKFSASSYEGRQRVEFGYDNYYEEVRVPSGAYIIDTDQRTLRIIMHLLQPESEDSFIRWGFLNTIFEQKEYFESYVMEREAEKMLEENPQLRKDFEERLAADEKFRSSPYQRLYFLYESSPWFDKNYRVYPILIVE